MYICMYNLSGIYMLHTGEVKHLEILAPEQWSQRMSLLELSLVLVLCLLHLYISHCRCHPHLGNDDYVASSCDTVANRSWMKCTYVWT